MITISLVIFYIVGVILMCGRSNAMLKNSGIDFQKLTILWKIAFYVDISLSFLSLIVYTIWYFICERNKKYLMFNKTLTK
jgi:hypothetical protein